MKKGFLVFSLSIICVFFSTCSKVSKKNSEFIGHWKTNSTIDCTHYLDIDLNDNGIYSAFGFKGCNIEVKGKVKKSLFTLFIGKMTWIISRPKPTNDTIIFENKYIQATSKMTLGNSLLHGMNQYTFYKYK